MSNSFKTFLKHTAKDFHNQSVNPPIVRASTIIFKSMQDIRKTQDKAKKNPTGGHFDYGRQGTSTTHILQQILSKLEESYFTFLTPTGFGAVFLAIFSVTRPGDERCDRGVFFARHPIEAAITHHDDRQNHQREVAGIGVQ